MDRYYLCSDDDNMIMMDVISDLIEVEHKLRFFEFNISCPPSQVVTFIFEYCDCIIVVCKYDHGSVILVYPYSL